MKSNRFDDHRGALATLMLLLVVVVCCGGCSPSTPATVTKELQKAIQFDDTSTVRRYIDAGLNVNSKDDRGYSLLEMAVPTRRTFQYLLEQGADANAPAKLAQGGNLLIIVASQGNQYGSSRDKAQLLVARGADPNSRDKDGYTPLHIAASRDYGLPMADYLVTKGADVNAASNRAETPLHYAAALACPECVNFLLLHGANVDAKDDQSNTPLLKAVKSSRLSAPAVAATLISHGADLSIKDKDGLTAEQFVEGKAHLAEVASVLNKHSTSAK